MILFMYHLRECVYILLTVIWYSTIVNNDSIHINLNFKLN